jgi:hypothetical protein
LPTDYEDRVDISGDPPAPQPLNPQQMQAAQKQQVNRTQMSPTAPKPQEDISPNGTGAQSEDKPEQKSEQDGAFVFLLRRK